MLGIENWQDKTRRLKMGVIGDFCLDRNNLYNNTGLKSLEYETVNIERNLNPDTEWAPGGAGNVAINFKKLEVDVVPFGIRGMDDVGTLYLMHLFEKQGIQTFGLIPDMARKTPRYEKFYFKDKEDKPQTKRLDTYNEREPSLGVQKLLFEVLQRELGYLSGVYIADQLPTQYHPCITSEVKRGLEEILGKAGIPVMVDSRERIGEWGNGKFILKPNEKETKAFSFFDVNKFVSEHKLPFMYVTAHEKGTYLFQENAELNKEPIRIPTLPVKNGDPTGCGDAWGAAALVALKVGESPSEAAKFGNAAAYHTIQQIGGCGMPDLEELFKNYKDIYG